MKFTAATTIAAIVCLLATRVCGDHDSRLLRRRAQQREDINVTTGAEIHNNATATTTTANDMHVFGPVVFDHQRQRRLKKGAYLTLFDDTVKDVERHAKRLAKKLGKEAKAIMKETIHAVYLKDLSDEDVEYVKVYPGVKEVVPNFEVTMFSPTRRASTTSTTSSSDSSSNDAFATALTPSEKARLTASEKRRRRRRKRRRRKKRQQQKDKPRPNKPDLQPVPWNIERVGGPHAYRGRAKVFVVDTGIDVDNEDLNVHLKFAKNFVDPGKDAHDDHGHGTYCAGIIGALDNTIGVVGVRPGVRVVPLKALDKDGAGDFAGIIEAVEWAAKHGKPGDVVNMSLGGGQYQPLDDAVRIAAETKDLIFVIASGNESQDASNVSPARLNHPNVWTVSAMDNSDNWAEFSNYGEPVDAAAPGQWIQSLEVGGGISGFIQGTSFAAPHIAALKLGETKWDGFVNFDPDDDADRIMVMKN